MAPHAPTTGMAHVGACLSVASELRARGHDVVFAYGGALPNLIESEGFAWTDVREVAPEREWNPRGQFGLAPELEALVESQARAIADQRPDVVVTSAGLPARIAAEAAGVPELHLMHHLPLTRFARATGTGIWGRRLRDARRPRRAARVLRNRLRQRRAPRVSPDVIAEVRTRLGLPAREIDLSSAALVACTTTPFLDPARGLPAHWRYVGPVGWSASPREGPEDSTTTGPLVHVTQGSTGSARLLRLAIEAIADEPVDVVATTATLGDPAELRELGPRVRAERYSSTDRWLAACDVAVVHGGHLSTAAALAAGRPVLVLPSRPDQIAWLDRVERLRVGLGLWPDPSAAAIRRAVRRLLSDPRYAERSAELAVRLREWDGPASAAGLAEELVTARSSSSAAAGATDRSSGSAQR